MANVITLLSNQIEFDIKGNLFAISLEDTEVEGYLAFIERLNENGEDLASVDKDNIKKAKALLIEGFDIFFGEGKGSAIYELCGRSSYVAINVMAQVVDELSKNIGENASARFNKYIENDSAD